VGRAVSSAEAITTDVDRVMGHVRQAIASNHRLNAAGVTYNVWLSRHAYCPRCGSVFTGHACHVVGSPGEAHRIAQPAPLQESLW
jgi:hypothetical protein